MFPKNRIMQAISMLALGALSLSAAEASAGSDKKTKFCDKSYDMDTGVVFFAFGNGTTLELDTKKCSEEIRQQLTCHGGSQKVGDSFAGVKGNFAEGIANAQDVIDQLYAGVWRAARDDDARPRLAELAEAIARIKNVDLEKAKAAVEAGTDEQRSAWRSNAKVKATIATIRAEKAAKALEEAGEQELSINV